MGLRVVYLVTCLGFFGLIAHKFDSQTGLTALLGFGESWEAARVEALGEEAPDYFVKADSGGYDGQFYALIALDPTLQDA